MQECMSILAPSGLAFFTTLAHAASRGSAVGSAALTHGIPYAYGARDRVSICRASCRPLHTTVM